MDLITLILSSARHSWINKREILYILAEDEIRINLIADLAFGPTVVTHIQNWSAPVQKRANFLER